MPRACESFKKISKKSDEEWLYQTDKAWDAIHRCLTDGKLEFNNGECPYSMCILGGQLLYSASDYIIALKEPSQVENVSVALAKLDETWFRERYFSMANDYGHPKSEDDFKYTWDWFKGLGEFFGKAAAAKRHIIFTVDQ